MPLNTPCRHQVNYTAHEDGCIHCIKPNKVAAGTARDVSKGTAKLNAAGLEKDSDDDPFASSDEMKDYETVINDE